MNLAALETAFEARSPGSGAASRRAALDALLEHGLPGRKSEQWKYTKAAPLAEFAVDALSTMRVAPADTGALRDRIASRLDGLDQAWSLVFIDGTLDETMTRLPTGVTLASRETATPGRPASADDALSLMNAALPDSDLALTVADDTVVDGVLHIFHAISSQGALSQVRLSIEMSARSRLTVAEHYADDAVGACMHNSVVIARVGEAASLHLRRLQSLGPEAYQVTRIEADVAEGGALDTITVDAGGRTVRNDLNVRLRGAGARVDMRGIYLGDGRQHIDNHTRVDHVARDTVSREDYRGILRDRSRGVFNGKVQVHEGADGTDAAQSNPNLLLSDQAEIDTKPELEIYADDVKCAHGATVGQIDETSLFYLRSRGIDETTAVQLLTWAFCREVLAAIADEPLRIEAERLVAEQIPDFSALELIV